MDRPLAMIFLGAAVSLAVSSKLYGAGVAIFVPEEAKGMPSLCTGDDQLSDDYGSLSKTAVRAASCLITPGIALGTYLKNI